MSSQEQTLIESLGNRAVLIQSNPFPCCTLTANRFVCLGCSSCPLLLVAKCGGGFICRTQASAEVDCEPVILSPWPWEGEITFSPTNTWFGFFPQLWLRKERKSSKMLHMNECLCKCNCELWVMARAALLCSYLSCRAED